MSQSIVTSNIDEALASLKALNEANDAAFEAGVDMLFAAPPPPPPPEPKTSSLPRHAYGAFRERLRTALTSHWNRRQADGS